MRICQGSFKSQQMCIKVTEDPWDLTHVPNLFKNQVMCNMAVCEDLCTLQFVPDWFVMWKLVEMWDDNDFDADDDHELE